jgi:L-fucose mutarotase
VLHLPGVDAPVALATVLPVLPLDDFEPNPALVMHVVGTSGGIAVPVRDFTKILTHHQVWPKAIERYAFYRATECAFAELSTGERRFYGNILLRKGVIPPETN